MSNLTKTEFIKLEIIKMIMTKGKIYYTDQELTEIEAAANDFVSIVLDEIPE